jgi:16S rRNA (uracil1498-N3)-methyltransferase
VSGATKDGFRPRFFASEGVLAAGRPRADREVLLDTEDSHHATAVLRLHPGDECEVVLAPSGAVHLARVVALGTPVRLELGDRLEGDAAGASYRREVWLVQALARPAVMDYLIEKGTETGASRFLLVPVAGSPRLPEGSMDRRLARWRKVAREAAKQSKQVAVPKVDVVPSLEAALADVYRAGAWSILLEPRATTALDEMVRKAAEEAATPDVTSHDEAATAVALWVGPEGGWSERELESFRTAGMAAARLGRGVLRTETAGPVAAALVRLGLRDW